jgi:hypothetical protein
MIYLTLVLCAAVSVTAWGNSGHQLTGAVAQRLLTPEAAGVVKALLPDWNGNLTRSATWADEVKYGKQSQTYGWSAKLHFVDSKDDAPKSCGYVQERDCPDGQCIVGAIANYTTRATDCKLDFEQRSEALKFVTHFFGDIAQPLHACAKERGGNEVLVIFDGESGQLNLHSVWDTKIVEKRMQAVSKTFNDYVDHLVTQAKNQTVKNTWTECLKDANATISCPIAWATDSEELNCDVVWKPVEQDPKQDLGGVYYENAWPIVEQQIIKAGVRMASFINAALKPCKNQTPPPTTEPPTTNKTTTPPINGTITEPTENKTIPELPPPKRQHPRPQRLHSKESKLLL